MFPSKGVRFVFVVTVMEDGPSTEGYPVSVQDTRLDLVCIKCRQDDSSIKQMRQVEIHIIVATSM